MTQNLPGEFGTLNASVSRQNYNTYYNNEEKSIESYNIGYGNVFKGVSLNVNYAYYKNSLNRKIYPENHFETERDNDHVVSVNISIPLQGRFKDQWVSYGASYNKDGDFNNYVGVYSLMIKNSRGTFSRDMVTREAEITVAYTVNIKGVMVT